MERTRKRSKSRRKEESPHFSFGGKPKKSHKNSANNKDSSRKLNNKYVSVMGKFQLLGNMGSESGKKEKDYLSTVKMEQNHLSANYLGKDDSSETH